MSDPASPPANTKHPLLQVTDNDHGPVLVVIAYSFLFTALITVFARIFLLYKLRRPRGLDDYLIVLAAVSLFPNLLERRGDNGNACPEDEQKSLCRIP